MTNIVTLTRVWVPGTPRTKGHLEVKNAGGTTKTGKRRAAYVEETPESVRWRMFIVDRVRVDMLACSMEYPYLGPVYVTAQFFQPITVEQWQESKKVAGSGDLDTLLRNVLDALSVNKDPAKGVGLIRDDMQVKGFEHTGTFPAVSGNAGLQLHVWYYATDVSADAQ